MKHLAKILLLVLACVMLLTACAKKDANPKEFIIDKFSITMTTEYEEYDASGFDFAYITERVLVLGIFDSLEDIEDLGFTKGAEGTAADYLSFVIERNKMTETAKVETRDGLDYFTYDAEADGTDFRYVAFAFPYDGGFCFVQFSCRTGDFKKYEADFFTYAKSAHFIVGDPNA